MQILKELSHDTAEMSLSPEDIKQIASLSVEMPIFSLVVGDGFIYGSFRNLVEDSE